MGVGKTTTAQQLAQKLSLPFLDLDTYIETQVGLSVPEIFKTKGAIYFRKQEHLHFKALMQTADAFVLSLGGGTPCYANNHLLLKGDNVTSIYLKASITTLHTRLKDEVSKRPILAQNREEQLDTFIAKQLFDRSYFYYQATQVVNVDNKSTDEVVHEIATLLNTP